MILIVCCDLATAGKTYIASDVLVRSILTREGDGLVMLRCESFCVAAHQQTRLSQGASLLSRVCIARMLYSGASVSPAGLRDAYVRDSSCYCWCTLARPEHPTDTSCLRSVLTKLKDCHGRGVVLIDEAQHMSPDALKSEECPKQRRV